MLKEKVYDLHFDEVRDAFLTDVAYSLLIARAANSIIARKEAQQEKKNQVVASIPKLV